MATPLTKEQEQFILGGGTIQTADPDILKAQETFIKSRAAGGIQLPDQPALPGVAGGIEIPPEIAGVATSLPSVSRADIEAKTKAELVPARGAIETRFGRRIGEKREEAKQRERALGGQLGVERRFSSSARAFIKFIDDSNQKKINDLEQQKSEALANFDFQEARLIDQRVLNERANQQQQFENAFKILEFGEKQAEAETQEVDTIIPESDRDAAVLDALGEGLTGIGDIFTSVRKAGFEITLEDVSSILETLGLSAGVKENAPIKLTGDANNFFQLRENFPDFIPTEISTLPEDQQLGAYIKFIEGGEKTGGDEGDINNLPGMTAFEGQALGIRIARAMFGSGRALSDQDREIGFALAAAGVKEGLSQIEILKQGLGYIIERNVPMADNLFKVLIANGEEGLSSMDLVGLAFLINNGNDPQAIQKTENIAYKEAQEVLGESFVSEPAVRIATRQVNNLIDFFNEKEMLSQIGDDVDLEGIGAFSGTMQKFITRRFRGEEEAQVLTRVKNLVKDMVKEMAGVNITADELKFIEDLIPNIDEPAVNFMFKLGQLKSIPMLKLNEIRDDRSMPKINEEQLFDRKKRIPLYSKIEFSDDTFFNNPTPTVDEPYTSSVWDNIELPTSTPLGI